MRKPWFFRTRFEKGEKGLDLCKTQVLQWYLTTFLHILHLFSESVLSAFQPLQEIRTNSYSEKLRSLEITSPPIPLLITMLFIHGKNIWLQESDEIQIPKIAWQKAAFISVTEFQKREKNHKYKENKEIQRQRREEASPNGFWVLLNFNEEERKLVSSSKNISFFIILIVFDYFRLLYHLHSVLGWSQISQNIKVYLSYSNFYLKTSESLSIF